MLDPIAPDVLHGTFDENGEISMDQDTINTLFEEVIREAQEVKIPVPKNIERHITINPRPKKRYGCCKHIGGKTIMEISAFVLKADEKKIKEVLAHELLHTCKGCQDHGARWKSYADRMNRAYGYCIKRVSSMEEMGLAAIPLEGQSSKVKYIIKCQQCGKEYPRQRFTCVMKKINAYRCQCGGKLTLLKKV